MLSVDELREVYGTLLEWWRAERARLTLIRSYMRAEATDIYVPRDASDEYHMLVAQARFNICPLVVTTVAQGLFVDGFRPTVDGLPQEEQSPLWEVWQRNRMDARQTAVYRPAITYGTSYLSVLPGDPAPVMTPLSPWRCTAIYDDDDDEWPAFALVAPHENTLALGAYPARNRPRGLGAPKVRVMDATHVYSLPVDALGNPDPSGFSSAEHGLGVCPVVRFRKIDDDGSASFGKIEPLLPVQRQINQTTFGLLMTQQFQAFRQRWVTGMAVEKDEQGNVIEPWNAAVNAVWSSDSADTKFGDFAETSLDGYLASRRESVLFAGSTAQVPPHNLLIADGISNIAAETLAALESAHQLDVGDYKTSFGEGIEQGFRLAGRAMGDEDAWDDITSEVSWRDTTPRSLGQLVDALGKMAAQLGIPPEELWRKIPGTTEQELARWRAAASQNDLMSTLEAMANGVVDPGVGVDPAIPPTAGAAQPVGGQPAANTVPVG